MTHKHFSYPNIETETYNIWKVENLDYLIHLHREIELVYVVSGSLNVMVEEQPYHLQAGDLVFVSSYQIHRFHSPEKVQCLSIGISPDKLYQFQEKYSGKKLVCPVFTARDYSPELTQLFEFLLHSSDLIQTLSFCLGMINSMIGYLWESQKVVEDSAEFSPTKQLLLYLYEHLKEPLTQSDASEALSMSPFQLSRLCNQKIGMGFNAYLNFLRITTAKRLLLYTDQSVAQIAKDCGFETVRTFNRAFREITGGQTPSSYRSGTQNPAFFRMSEHKIEE